MELEDEIKTVKVILLGESGVGKTSIISRYVSDTVDDFVLSTVGASYVSKTMQFQDYSNQSLRYEIWDTAGQERFRSLTRIFYKDAAIAILVYAVPNRQSFIQLKEYWYNQIEQYAPKDISINNIAGNKSDITSGSDEVDETETRQFAQDKNAYFRLTSAKDGLGIDDLFKAVGTKFLDPEYNENDLAVKKRSSVSSSIKKVHIIPTSVTTHKKKCC